MPARTHSSLHQRQAQGLLPLLLQEALAALLLLLLLQVALSLLPL
jgi:hypothetical protein